jgi:uncharacterized protein (TIRG00374 family)
MKTRFRTVLKYLFSLGLSLLFLYLAFRDTDFEKLGEAFYLANYWWALAMFPLLMLSHAFRAWRWRYLLEPVKRQTRFRNLFSALVIGYMMNNVLPRAGEFVRPYAIGKLEGLSRSAAFGTVLMERILDVASFMILIAFIPMVYTGPLNEALPWLEETGVWISVTTLGILGLFVFLMMRRDVVMNILNFFTRRLSKKRAELVEHIAHSFLDGFLFLKQPKNYFAIIILTILVWGLYVAMMYVPFYAFGLVDKYNLDMASAMVVQAISSIGIIVPTPGATGPYHFFTIQTLTKLYDVDVDIARSYAIVTHAMGFIGVTLVGLFYFLKDQLHISEVMVSQLQTRVVGTNPDDSRNS